jgi:hypothetical protein
MDDYRRSLERVGKSEKHRGQSGFGFTGQSGVIIDHHLADLAEWVRPSLADKRRSASVRRALRYLDNEQIARRLLIAGISVAMGKRFGVDEDTTTRPQSGSGRGLATTSIRRPAMPLIGPANGGLRGCARCQSLISTTMTS